MQTIMNVRIESHLDLDYGEGCVAIAWLDGNDIPRSLTIDADGHCSREMQIRSGKGVSIGLVLRDRVRLRFTAELAKNLELDQELEFVGNVAENAFSDLLRLADAI